MVQNKQGCLFDLAKFFSFKQGNIDKYARILTMEQRIIMKYKYKLIEGSSE